MYVCEWEAILIGCVVGIVLGMGINFLWTWLYNKIREAQ